MNTEYPLLSFDDMETASLFRNALSAAFENKNLHFFIKRDKGRYGVHLEERVTDSTYFNLYQYCQKIYREYYEWDSYFSATWDGSHMTYVVSLANGVPIWSIAENVRNVDWRNDDNLDEDEDW